MPDVFVAKASQFPDGERRIVKHGAREIGVFHWQGQFFAYENLCLHQGGPACEGVMMHKVEDVLGPDRTWQGRNFPRTKSTSSVRGTATNTISKPANAPPTAS